MATCWWRTRATSASCAITPNGEFVNQVGGGGVVAGRFEEPTDVAVDPTDGSILVADAWNQRIQRLGADLAFQAEYRGAGLGGA